MDSKFSKLLDNSPFDLTNTVLFAQGKVPVKLSYISYVEDIQKSFSCADVDALKVADAFATQIAIYGYSRNSLENVRVKIDDRELKLTGRVLDRLKVRLTQGSDIRSYNPKRICSYRSKAIRKFINDTPDIDPPNLMKKLKLPSKFKEFAFIGSEYSAENVDDCYPILYIAELLDNSDIKKDNKIKQFDKVFRFLNASSFNINLTDYEAFKKDKI